MSEPLSQAAPEQQQVKPVAGGNSISKLSNADTGLAAFGTKGGAAGPGGTAAPLVEEALSAARIAAPLAPEYLAGLFLKATWKTGEFWLLVLGLAVLNCLCISGQVVNGNLAALVDVISPLVFQGLRQSFKDDQHEKILDLLNPEILANANREIGEPVGKAS